MSFFPTQDFPHSRHSQHLVPNGSTVFLIIAEINLSNSSKELLWAIVPEKENFRKYRTK